MAVPTSPEPEDIASTLGRTRSRRRTSSKAGKGGANMGGIVGVAQQVEKAKKKAGRARKARLS